MNDRLAFLSAIAQTPDEDAVRLVFADWLDEHGEDDRAQLVRLQCQASCLPRWCPERRWLLWCAEQVLARRPEWRAELPSLEGVTWGRFERGFVAEAIVADFDCLLRHAAAIGAVGTVSEVFITRTQRDYPMDRLPALPWLRSLVLDAKRFSRLGSMLYSDGVARLASAPMLATLHHLRIDSHWSGAEGVRALARSAHLGPLTSLSIADAHDDASAWPELLASPRAAGLRRLGLRAGGISVFPGFRAEVAAPFAAAPSLAALQSLDISNRCVDPNSYELLLRSGHVAALRELEARQQLLKADDLAPFADTAARPRLVSLDVSQSHFRRAGLAHLLSARCLAGLERLGLADCRLTGPDCDLLTTALWRPTLTALDLSQNRLQAAGLRRLFAADWPRLRELGLAETGLKTPAALELAKWPGLTQLRTLDVRGNDLGGDVERRLREAVLPADARLMVDG
jgi:uncharacterized protein (TIGR02996 family)